MNSTYYTDRSRSKGLRTTANKELRLSAKSSFSSVRRLSPDAIMSPITTPSSMFPGQFSPLITSSSLSSSTNVFGPCDNDMGELNSSTSSLSEIKRVKKIIITIYYII